MNDFLGNRKARENKKATFPLLLNKSPKRVELPGVNINTTRELLSSNITPAIL